MKFLQSVHKFYEMLAGADKVKALQLLQQQRQLLAAGIEVLAEIMDISLMPKAVGTLQQVRLCIKLKKADGSFIYTHTSTLVSLNNMPQKGQLLRIKYSPDDLSSVVLM